MKMVFGRLSFLFHATLASCSCCVFGPPALNAVQKLSLFPVYSLMFDMIHFQRLGTQSPQSVQAAPWARTSGAWPNAGGCGQRRCWGKSACSQKTLRHPRVWLWCRECAQGTESTEGRHAGPASAPPPPHTALALIRVVGPSMGTWQFPAWS